MEKRLIRVSKYLAKYLRHAPHELGLELQPGGWVLVDDLLAAAEKNGFPISCDELVDCVETNDKQRFAFDVTGELIRANQGHSVEVDLQLEAPLDSSASGREASRGTTALSSAGESWRSISSAHFCCTRKRRARRRASTA